MIARLALAALLIGTTPALAAPLVPQPPLLIKEVGKLRYRLEAALKSYAYDPNTPENRRYARAAVEDLLAHHDAVETYTVDAGDALNPSRREMWLLIRVRLRGGHPVTFPCRVDTRMRSVSC